MITYHDGNILDSGADIICHQVNCRGVMGGGLAKQIKERYPKVYKEYKKLCDCEVIGNPPLGCVQWVSLKENTVFPCVCNLFAQVDYGIDKRQTEYWALRDCFDFLFEECDENYPLCTIAIPSRIGCGLAGGDWDIVLPIIDRASRGKSADIQIWKLRSEK